MPYLDFPELKFNEHESTEMPFRYVRGQDDEPIMPKVIGVSATDLATGILNLAIGYGRTDPKGRRQVSG